MFLLLADESGWLSTLHSARSWALGLSFQTAAILVLIGGQWLLSLLPPAASADPPPPPQIRETLTILAPPPGKSSPRSPLSFNRSPLPDTPAGASAKLEDSTEIAFEADEARQLVPVLRENDGLIVFSPVLDHLHPRLAYHPDGTAAPIPASLNHWVRIRLANPAWWPEVESLCSQADPSSTLEAIAVFPPAYRSKLGEAVQARITGLKSAARIVGVSLRLEAGRPAGVVIRTVRLATPTG